MARETSLEERLRKDQERADDNKSRQTRLGYIVPEVEVVPEPKSKPKSRAKSK